MTNNKRAITAAVCTAGLLHSAADAFGQAEVSGYKLRRQAGVVARNCTRAIESVSADMVLRDADGNRTLHPAAIRQMIRASDAFVRIAAARLERRQMYCAEFAASRVMACDYTIDHMVYQFGLPKPWRKLVSVTRAMLQMLMRELGQHEAVMFGIAESFQCEITPVERRKAA